MWNRNRGRWDGGDQTARSRSTATAAVEREGRRRRRARAASVEAAQTCFPGRYPGRRFRIRAERGQAVVEFALVLPLLMLVIVGILKFGQVYNNYIQLTNAVDSGARLFAIERGQASPCTDTTAQVVASAGGLDPTSLSMTLSDSNDPSHTYTYTGSANPQGSGVCPSLGAGDPVRLSASYPCDLDIFGIKFTVGLCSLSASATESVQ